jgi:hypothetical protein
MVRPGYWIAWVERPGPALRPITIPCPHQYHSRNDLALACAQRILKENQP